MEAKFTLTEYELFDDNHIRKLRANVLKSYRYEQGKSLNEMFLQYKTHDPGNISKMERGLRKPKRYWLE